MPVSVRNVSEGSGLGSQLREFKGRLDVIAEAKSDRFEGMNNVLTFSNLEVIQTETPYTSPFAQLMFSQGKGQSTSPNSRWGVFSNSIVKFLADNQDIPDLQGKVLHIKAEPNKIWSVQDNGLKEQLAWVCVGVEGVAASNGAGASVAAPASSAADAALALLDGKNATDFQQAAIQSETVRKDTTLTMQIIQAQWLNSDKFKAEYGSRVTVDDQGVYHVAAQ